MQIQGWGRYPKIEAEVIRPQTATAIQQEIVSRKENGKSLIPFGLGRSYGDSALSTSVANLTGLNLLLAFDASTGVLKCQAGVSLAEILEVFVPRGWFLPVSPGTKFVTVGGAIASDVHGKNHHSEGCFSDFVESFEIIVGTGELLTCSRTENSDLFRATCGGMGLTGVISSATIRLKKISSGFIEQKTYKAANLDEVYQLFEQSSAVTYSVAWIDCLAKGDSLGRSLLMVGEHANDGRLDLNSKKAIDVPIEMPSSLLNRYSIQAFNTLYYNRVFKKYSEQLVHFEPFFYPLDRLHNWNRMYGREGFTQYQFVVPKVGGLVSMRAILKRIADSKKGSFLAVLKAFGKQNENLISFPQEGYTLALDFKIEADLFPLLDDLDRMVLDYGGRVYLTKDVRMTEQTFKKSYARWEEFQTVREKYNALNRFSSEQSRRIGLNQ